VTQKVTKSLDNSDKFLIFAVKMTITIKAFTDNNDMTRDEKVQHCQHARRREDPTDCRTDKTDAAMDTPRVLSRDEALNLVRRYKQVIMPRFNGQAKVLMFGSYSKGYANQWSDIDVAVIVPTVPDDKWLETSVQLGKDSDKVSLLIEPVLMAEDRWSPLYDDVMQTGVAV